MEKFLYDILIPLHPKIVHFPIALFVTALVLELLSRLFKKERWSQAAFIIYCFAAIITPGIVLSGLWEADRLHLHHPLLNQHKTFGLWTMWVALGSLPLVWFLQRFPKIFRTIFLMLLIVLSITVTMASYYGGKMVYEYAVAVSPSF